MASILESFEIESPQYGRRFKIDLAEGLDASHLDFMEARWTPELNSQFNLAMLRLFQLSAADRTPDKWHKILAEFAVEDQHWVWRNKCAIAPGTNRRVFSLLNAADVEAAMVLLFGKSSRDQAGSLPMVYVDFVAVAPWNRRKFQHPQRFRSLGTVLLGAAVELSQALGLEGRCGLHSLPQSEGFYRRIGMHDFGVDAAYSSLRYFEFDAAGAANFGSR